MRNLLLSTFLLCVSIGLHAQESMVKNVPFTNIGPTIMSGRIVDVAVNPAMTTEMYVAYASGGLWYTDNNGTTFSPVMDNAPTQNIGDIAVDWKNDIIWVGTGENNSSRSSYAGIGLLKSTDKGKTWEYMGLPDSHHIGRIILNDKNPDEVIVGVIGHLYTPNKERGMYKTIDGGKTWKNTLFIDENTGVIDVVQSPKNKNIVFAAAWERDRKAWNFSGNGAKSAIYKSVNFGDTWVRVTHNRSGFPSGNGVGRIGLAVYNDDVIYALLDNQERRPVSSKKKKKNEGLQKDDFKNMSVESFLNLSDKKLNGFLKRNGFQEKYRSQNVKNLVKNKTIQPKDVALYLENANAALFDTPVKGAELYKSINGGLTWSKTHADYIDDLVFSYGYYFAVVAVNPNNADDVYVAGVPILKSKDGGETFVSINKENVHVDHHALWINPKNKRHLVLGNDGGLNISYDDGESWIKCNQPAVGQFYAINVDYEKKYNVYGGLQDNGVWKGPNTYKASKYWNQNGKYPYTSLLGGDGMKIEIDRRNSDILYTGFQFGNYYRFNLKTGEQTYIQPKHDLGENPLRFNWQTPILLSKHNQDILYLGSNKLHRSFEKGANFSTISKDLTQGGKEGNVAFGTLTSISESPFKFGQLIVGSDDGLVHVTKDGGTTWSKVSKNLPSDFWVSRVITSQHQKARLYVALNGYRNDVFTAMLYKSEDFGVTWTSISSGLPASPINVIIEDNTDADLLYVGNDSGVHVSFDQGASWNVFKAGLPKVAVHDLVLQTKAKDLLIGTHGRSIYKANIAALQQVNKVKNNVFTLFDIEDKKHSKSWGKSWSKWLEPNTPTIDIVFFSKKKGNCTFEVLSEDGTKIQMFKSPMEVGLNYITFDVSLDATYGKRYFDNKEIHVEKAKNKVYYLPKGTYTIRASKNKNEQTFKIK
ncbi:MAG: glycosyl hydrolase [Flavobacteriaceae bacterium]|nr:MAG: glycosyl hydrolase [Flavobacteriaceae bacterium]PCI35471.1 MAG: glycosyl hydrolase [Flavobacteriaceae bacterium]